MKIKIVERSSVCEMKKGTSITKKKAVDNTS